MKIFGGGGEKPPKKKSKGELQPPGQVLAEAQRLTEALRANEPADHTEEGESLADDGGGLRRVPALTSTDRRWTVKMNEGRIPTEKNEKMRERVEARGYTPKQYDAMDPMTAAFLALGGYTADGESKPLTGKGRHLNADTYMAEEESEEQEELILEDKDRMEPLTPKEEKNELRLSVDELQRVTGRDSEREKKAQAFAERHGIEGVREEMLAAEREYAAAVKAAHMKLLPMWKVDREVHERYVAARLNWRATLNAVANNSADIDARDKVMARFIGLRDTAMREEKVRQDARAEALDEKGKTVLGKAYRWAKKGSMVALKGSAAAARAYGKTGEFIGTWVGAGRVSELALNKVLGGEADEQKRAERRARAARIVGSAAIMSVLVAGTGGVAAAPVLIDFVVRAARGSVGLIAGTAGGALAGKAFERVRAGAIARKNAEDRADFLDLTKSKAWQAPTSEEDLKREAKALQKGTLSAISARTKTHEELRKHIEVGVAAAVGGVSAFGSSYAINAELFGHTEAVQDAAAELQAEDTHLDYEKVGMEDDVTSPHRLDYENVGMNDDVTSPPQLRYEQPGFYEGVTGGEAQAVDTVKEAGASAIEPPPETPPAATAPEAAVPNAEVTWKGANQLFFDLKHELRELYPDAGKAPPAVQHLLNDKGAVEWSKAFGFFKVGEHGEIASRIMHEGDKLLIDPKTGELSFYDSVTGKPVALMDAKGNVVPGSIEKISAGIREPALPPQTAGAAVESSVSPSPESAGEESVAESPATQAAEPVAQGIGEESAAAANAGADALIGTPIADWVQGAERVPGVADSLPQVNLAEAATSAGNSIETSTIGTPIGEWNAQHESMIPSESVGATIFTNSQGVEINPAVPAPYLWDIPNTDLTYQVAFGGTPLEAANFAKEYVTKWPNTSMLYMDTEIDQLTGQETQVVRGWVSDADGKVSHIQNPVNPQTGQPFSLIRPDSLIGKVKR